MQCETGIRTVLAMADRSHMQRTLGALLPLRVEVVASVFNGSEALNKVAEAMPDLLLTDMVLPVWDGLELVRRIKDLPVFTMPLAIMMRPAPMYPFDERALEMGVYKLLDKPFEGGEVRRAVEEATILDRLPRTNLSEERIRDCLWSLGFSARLPGTQYLTRAIYLTSLDCRIAKSLSDLYEEVGA